VTNLEVDNDSLRSRHPDIFKNEEFDFCPTNDLIKLMPFDFVNDLVWEVDYSGQKMVEGR
jgi:hypothetical protein